MSNHLSVAYTQGHMHTCTHIHTERGRGRQRQRGTYKSENRNKILKENKCLLFISFILCIYYTVYISAKLTCKLYQMINAELHYIKLYMVPQEKSTLFRKDTHV